MKKVALLHYLPLGFYPPTINLINIASKDKNLKLKIWTAHNNKIEKKFNYFAEDALHELILKLKS